VRFVGSERAPDGADRAAERTAEGSSTRAFRIAGGSRGGALLVHGFTGTPHEMLPLAEPLARAGFDVLGVRLPGHGAADPGEPNEWSAWRDAVAAGLAELEASGADSVVVVGLSMGALLAIDLAHASPRVGAIVALCRCRSACSSAPGVSPRPGSAGASFQMGRATSGMRPSARATRSRRHFPSRLRCPSTLCASRCGRASTRWLSRSWSCTPGSIAPARLPEPIGWLDRRAQRRSRCTCSTGAAT